MKLFESAKKYTSTSRTVLFLFLVLISGALISYRLINLTYVQHAKYVEAAQNQYVDPSKRLAGRGNIYFSDGITDRRVLVASNVKKPYLYSNNSEILHPKDVASALSSILDIEEADLEKSLLKDKSYEMLARSISGSDAEAIDDLDIKGLIVGWEVSRHYPLDQIGSHVLGFVGFKGSKRVGQYGIESYYDATLAGHDKTQKISGNQTYGSLFGLFSSNEVNASDVDFEIRGASEGEDVVLTIDANVQAFIESKLEALVEQWSAKSGSIIIQDPETGAILAMASFPSYSPNSYWEGELSSYANPVIQKMFEPGSSFKAITMAAALGSDSVGPNSTYNDTGSVEIAEYTIRNSDKLAHGIQTMRDVLKYSLNTGTIYAQKKTGNDTFLNYVVEFGFGSKTGIDLAGELEGNISNLYSGRTINFYTASFGQGIAVTPLQLINAYSAIANGGKLMKPYVTKEIVHANGSKTITEPEILDVPISETTATQMKSMLAEVVEERFTKAHVPGYDIAGKTGTAQIPDDEGGYLEGNNAIHNIVGFAPAYNPEFTLLIKLDRPQEVKFAANSLTPTFGEIANFLLHYLNVPPTN